MTTKDVIIIGAPRSGTNMLRDILTSFDGIGTWPCDEINYIWRHGNVQYPSDEIPSERASRDVKRYIKSKFDSIRTRYDLDVVVEKTCANSLRVPFVDAVMPDAKYVFICRDGIDAAGSAKLRWSSRLDLEYVLEKVRFVPTTDLPYYALRYVWSRVYKFFSKEKRLAFWGPALDNMQLLLKTKSLNEVCVLQWKSCVDYADQALSNMPDEKVVRVRYEDFVSSPAQEMQRILEFIGYKVNSKDLNKAVASVTSGSVGKGRSVLDDNEIRSLEELVQDTLKHHNYL